MENPKPNKRDEKIKLKMTFEEAMKKALNTPIPKKKTAKKGKKQS